MSAGTRRLFVDILIVAVVSMVLVIVVGTLGRRDAGPVTHPPAVQFHLPTFGDAHMGPPPAAPVVPVPAH